jgi:hypothetical protein
VEKYVAAFFRPVEAAAAERKNGTQIMYRKFGSAGRTLDAMVTASSGSGMSSRPRGSDGSGCSRSASALLSFGVYPSSSSNALSHLPFSSLLISYIDASVFAMTETL